MKFYWSLMNKYFIKREKFIENDKLQSLKRLEIFTKRKAIDKTL
jgi:hypothetical protein